MEPVHQSLCQYQCECLSCTIGELRSGQRNSLCPHCRTTYMCWGQLSELNGHYKCYFCQNCVDFRCLLMMCEGDEVLACFDCFRFRRIESACQYCAKKFEPSQVTYGGQCLVDCCMDVKSGVQLCGCKFKHVYHSECVAPCGVS